jgi:hypothetical protein
MIVPTRIACSNAINLALKEAPRHWRCVHSGNPLERIAAAKEILLGGTAYMEALTAEAENLQKIKLTDDKVIAFTNRLFPIVDGMTDRIKETRELYRSQLLQVYNEKDDLQGFGNSGYRFIGAVADYIDHNNLPVSIFSTRYEDFWALNYKIQPGMEENTPQNPKRLIPLLPDNFIDRIVHNVKFEPGDPLQFLNIIIKYFNKEDLLQDDLDCIDNFDIISIPEPYDTQLYYQLIFTIFCIDYYCKMCLR